MKKFDQSDQNYIHTSFRGRNFHITPSLKRCLFAGNYGIFK